MKNTVYDERYKTKQFYWEFRPSSMAIRALDLLPPLNQRPKVLEIGCGEGGTAIFLARNGYEVTAFDWSEVAVSKTRENAERAEVSVNVFRSNINDFAPTEKYDLIFSSGTLQYLLPEKRVPFIASIKANTNEKGINILHTFVSKPFIAKAPDAEANEYLWRSGELLCFYEDWLTENFVEEIRPCNSSGISHKHAHNRIWSRRP